MRKDVAIELAGGKPADLAAVFEPPLTPAAVRQWGSDIPPLRDYQLRELKPKWFRPDQQEAALARVKAKKKLKQRRRSGNAEVQAG